MQIDELHPVEDISRDTVLKLATRIEQSKTYEQLIYRESEIDELWRLLDQGNGGGADGAFADALRTIVIDVHDRVGVDGDTSGAARALRQIVVEAGR